MTRLEIQTQIRDLREELEARHQSDTVKIATAFAGKTASTLELQNKLFNLLYKLSKIE